MVTLAMIPVIIATAEVTLGLVLAVVEMITTTTHQMKPKLAEPQKIMAFLPMIIVIMKILALTLAQLAMESHHSLVGGYLMQ